MKYDLNKLESLVKQGYLRKSEKDNLVLYGYTDHCTYERAWDEYTTVARGLILDKDTGEVVAKPFPKFFNLGEREETMLKNLPNEPYEVFEKVDGSLGIVFYHNGQWTVATRGSFYSDQAVKAQQLLQKYKFSAVMTPFTFLVEILYPENKIIVNYGQTQGLVLLGAFRTQDGEEVGSASLKAFADGAGLPLANRYSHSIEKMIELQKTMPKDQEGFVVRFENGLRVKIKGDEYMRLAKLMANLSPIALWETMQEGKVDRSYLTQLPEEFQKEYEPIVVALEHSYADVKATVEHLCVKHDLSNKAPDWKRQVGVYLKENTVPHSGAVFPYLLGNVVALDNYILKFIRPTGNVLIKGE